MKISGLQAFSILKKNSFLKVIIIALKGLNLLLTLWETIKKRTEYANSD